MPTPLYTLGQQHCICRVKDSIVGTVDRRAKAPEAKLPCAVSRACSANDVNCLIREEILSAIIAGIIAYLRLASNNQRYSPSIANLHPV